ncbi:MAG: riboflavin synthase [Bryobacterales bacterium]|nr:riboflavin synthase [Bryobacterales bacterium]MDE0294887.1 riboflavin synthase [Bryobacterales bacterium]
MFTGIIEQTGSVQSLIRATAGARLSIRTEGILSDLTIGASIAVNGACLTAVEVSATGFAADLSPETLDKTNLGSLQTGSLVNLEQPLAPGDRLSGHFVLGHVDGTGEITRLDPAGDGNWLLEVRVPKPLRRYLVFKGSIAIDGVSLTLASVEDVLVSVAIIPHTYQATALHTQRPGAEVNIECDILAKHVEKLLGNMTIDPGSNLTVEDLKQQGY